MMNLSVHRVIRIELISKNDRNSHSRTIRITTEDGENEVTLYGNTFAVDLLPRSVDFTDFTNGNPFVLAEKV